MAKQANFQVFQNTDVNLDFKLENTDGSPLDLTNRDVRWRFAKEIFEPSIVEKSSTGSSGINITDSTGGAFTVSLTAGDLADRRDVYYHETVTLDSSDNTNVVSFGFMTVRGRSG